LRWSSLVDWEDLMRTRLARPVAFAVVVAVLVGFGACGGRGDDATARELPGDCEALIAAQETCAKRQGLPARLSAGRADAKRAELRASIKDMASRDRVEARCAMSRREVEESCR
jgi:hypothetical protein